MFTKSVMAVTLAGFVAALSAPAFANPGTDQLAKQMGVDAGAYTLNELVQLQDAYNDNDTSRIAFILGGSHGGNTNSDVGVVTPAKAQIAAVLNVDPAAYTTLKLVQMVNDL